MLNDKLLKAIEQDDAKEIKRAIKSLNNDSNNIELKTCLDTNKFVALINEADDEGKTYLHHAIVNKKPNAISTLLETGASPNLPDKEGLTPLHLTAKNNHLNLTQLLLEKGAHPNIQDVNNSTPLHYAARHGHAEITNILLEKGANPNIQDKYGWPPLFYTAKHDHLNVVKTLIEHNENLSANKKTLKKFINFREPLPRGITALYLATYNNCWKIVEYLLEKGANETLLYPQKNGYTAFEVAIQKGYTETITSFGNKTTPQNPDRIALTQLKNTLEKMQTNQSNAINALTKKLDTVLSKLDQLDQIEKIHTDCNSAHHLCHTPLLSEQNPAPAPTAENILIPDSPSNKINHLRRMSL